MVITLILTTTLLATTPDADRLLRAFAMAESTNRNLPPKWDRTQYSWGVYQFGRDRWAECGGKPDDWGRAGRAEQERVMRRAIERYTAAGRKRGHKGRALFNWIARSHNGGPSPKPNAYTKRLRAAYETGRK